MLAGGPLRLIRTVPAPDEIQEDRRKQAKSA